MTPAGVLLAIVIAATTIGGVLFARRSGLPWFNPVTVAGVGWGSVTMTAAWPGVLLPSLSGTTLVVLLVAWVVFVVSSVAGWHASRSSRVPPTALPQADDSGRLRTQHLVLSGVLLAFTVLQVVLEIPVLDRVGGIQGLLTGGASEIRAAQNLVRSEVVAAGISGGSALLSLLGYALFLGHAALFTGGALWRRGSRLLALLPVALAAVLSLCTFQRTYFVMALLLFASSVWLLGDRRSADHRPLKPRSGLRRGVLLGSAAGVALIVLVVPIALRNAGTRNSSGLQSLLEYALSGIAGFNQSVGVGDRTALLESSAPSLGYGAYTFWSAASILRRLGVPAPDVPHAYEYVTTYIGGQEFATNVGTALLDFSLDGAWIGVFLGVAVAGFSVAWLQRRVTAGYVFLLPLAAWGFTAVAWSFFVDVVTRDVRYIFLAVVASIFLLLRWRRTSRRQAPSDDRVKGADPDARTGET